MKTRVAIAMTIVAVLGASSVIAATFVVPEDDWITRHADAIVAGTVTQSRTRVGTHGVIETVYTVRLDETIKGIAPDLLEIELTELGGSLDGAMFYVSGTPSYEVGERYLVFMRKVADRWVTFDLVAGSFRFDTDETGETILVRDEGLVDAGSGSTTVSDRSRHAREFLSRVKEVVRQQADHDVFEGHYMTSSDDQVEPGDVALAAAVAAGAWSGDSSSAITYSVSAEPATGLTTGDDGEARVIRDDPQDLIPGTFGVDSSVLAVAVYGCRAGECLLEGNEVNGIQFANITWADVVLNDVDPSVTFSQPLLNTVLAHEFGHTLGFRHSDRLKNTPNPSDPTFVCAEPSPCSERAVMTSVVDEALNGQLTSWDQDAAAAVYGETNVSGFAPSEYVDDLYLQARGEWYPGRRYPANVTWHVTASTCQAVVISNQPSGTTIEEGTRALLSVDANGSALQYQWFEGETGDRSRPAGYGNPFSTPVLTESTSYWVLVRNSCSLAESVAARIEVTPDCPTGAFCALSGRFTIRLRAIDQRTNRSGAGQPHPENDIFGFFSVPALTGDSGNPEVFVKVLDGRTVNGQFWVFYGGLTDLEYTLSVLDNETGETRQYHKPAGSTAGGFDVGDGVAPETCVAETDGQVLSPVTPAPCQANEDELCLEDGRFKVVISARDQRSGRVSDGAPIRQNDLSGYFALPEITGNPENPEVFVKVLDGRDVNGYFWVFFSGLTDLEYHVIVIDTQTGARKAYTKDAGSACGAFDTNAF